MSAVDKRMTKGRSALVISQPFFGTLAMHLEIVELPDGFTPDGQSVTTMATDGKHLFYYPPWLDTLSELECRGVIAHEVLHCAYRHHTRRQERDPKIWNIAGDFCINRDLLAAGFVLPKEGCFDKTGRFKDMNAERIYEILKQEDNAKPKDQRMAGSGKRGEPGNDPGGCGGVLDAAPASEPAELAKQDKEWEVRVRQALNVAAAGKAPAALQRIANAIAKSTVDWRDMLRRFIDDAIQTDYSWTRPNKRMLHSGFILPSQISDGISKIGIVLDTSGSVDDRTVSRFLAEIRAAMDAGAIQQLVTISCDTRVYNPQEFSAGDDLDIKPKGGGGTMFSPALQWFEENHPDCAALIYFTDLGTSDFGNEPSCPLLWAVWGNYRPNLPFGEIVELDAA